MLFTHPGPPDHVGLLILAGSSGRVGRARARLFAGHGLTTLAVRWFGGAGQPSAPCEVPLETFTAAVDLLAATGVSRIGILGTSKGAEAALLTAVRDPRVDVVAAILPPAHVLRYGGTAEVDARLGTDALATILAVLRGGISR